MKRGLLTLCALLTVASVTACSDDDSAESPPSATVGTAPTTSTTLSVEQEVEAAYLRSWDVYTEAVLTFDTSELEEVFAKTALQTVRDEVAGLRAAGTPVRAKVDHQIDIDVIEAGAIVLDNYVNHSVLLDPETKKPSEPDPNKRLLFSYHLEEVDGSWKVVGIDRLS